MTTVEISLPDDLAKTARDAGLLAPDAIQGMLRQQLRTRSLEDLRRVWAAMPADELTPAVEQDILDVVRQCRLEARGQQAKA